MGSVVSLDEAYFDEAPEGVMVHLVDTPGGLKHALPMRVSSLSELSEVQKIRLRMCVEQMKLKILRLIQSNPPKSGDFLIGVVGETKMKKMSDGTWGFSRKIVFLKKSDYPWVEMFKVKYMGGE